MIASSNVFKVDGSVAMTGVFNQSNSTDATSLSAASIVTLAGIAVTKKAFIGDDMVIGSLQTIILENKLTMRGTTSNIAGPHQIIYTSTDQYPVFQQLNWSHDNIAQLFDAYYDGTNWKSSLSTSNYQIYKFSNQLQFNYNSGVAAGTIFTWNTAGLIDTSGILNWNKTIKTSAAVSSTSTSTGAIIASAGGIGCSGNLNVGGSANITGNVAIGKTTSASGALEVVGTIVATNNGGLSDVQLYVNPNASGTYSILQAFKQSVGDRDLQILTKNLAIGSSAGPSFGGGYGCLFIANRTTAPTTNPVGGGLLYAEAGALKWRGSSGTVTIIGPA